MCYVHIIFLLFFYHIVGMCSTSKWHLTPCVNALQMVVLFKLTRPLTSSDKTICRPCFTSMRQFRARWQLLLRGDNDDSWKPRAWNIIYGRAAVMYLIVIRSFFSPSPFLWQAHRDRPARQKDSPKVSPPRENYNNLVRKMCNLNQWFYYWTLNSFIK